MNEKVKVKFMRCKNVVRMGVLEMPEKYRGKGVLISGDDIDIESCAAPGLTSYTLYLPGEIREYDENYGSITLKDEKQAIDYINKFSSLIHELNERDGETEELTSEITIAE